MRTSISATRRSCSARSRSARRIRSASCAIPGGALQRVARTLVAFLDRTVDGDRQLVEALPLFIKQRLVDGCLMGEFFAASGVAGESVARVRDAGRPVRRAVVPRCEAWLRRASRRSSEVARLTRRLLTSSCMRSRSVARSCRRSWRSVNSCSSLSRRVENHCLLTVQIGGVGLGLCLLAADLVKLHAEAGGELFQVGAGRARPW